MPDWTKPMSQSFEYYTVDPNTWKDVSPIRTVKSASINRDGESETLGYATFDVNELVGECYIRTYLVTIQNGLTEKHPLGTFLVQTPSSSFNGKVRTSSMDAYTPLLELKENPPPIGYSILKDENVMNRAYQIIRENARAPVVPAQSDKTLLNDFVSNTDDTWTTFVRDLVNYAEFELGLDELGRIIFLPKQDLASLQPVWTFTDDNSSILYANITMNHDLYGIPNVVEVVYSSGNDTYTATVTNDDPNSPISTVNRGRVIKYRDTNPSFAGMATQAMVDEYAKKLLKALSTVEYSVSFTHGYCPVRLGDCIRLNYTRARLVNVKAKVINQTIKCDLGCQVSTKAVYTTNLWG